MSKRNISDNKGDVFFDWNGDGHLIHRNAGDPSSNLGGPTTLSSNLKERETILWQLKNSQGLKRQE